MTDSREDIPAFHRGNSDPLGKLDDKIDEFRIDSETKAILNMQAVRQGKTLAEWMRFMSQVQAHGLDRIRKLHLQKFDAVGNLSDMRANIADEAGPRA